MSDLLEPKFLLREYQRQVATDLMDVLTKRGAPKAVAHLPTGAGKTRIGSYVSALLLARAKSASMVVVWLAASEDLCAQACEALSDAWYALGNRNVHLHRFWGRHDLDFKDLSGGFLVAGLSKLYALERSNSGFLAAFSDRVALVVFDEAHQAIARTYRDITEGLLFLDSPLLGLTATPGRAARLGEADEELARMFNGIKVGIDPDGYPNAVDYLVHQGYLAEASFIPVEGVIKQPIHEPPEGSDYSTPDLEQLGADDAWFEAMAQAVKRALRRHQRLIVFAPSVTCALRGAKHSWGPEVNAAAIVAGTPSEIRSAAISEFREKSARGTRILFNYGVFTAGFDAPATSCVIIARPTTSLVLYSQMAGRAMRGRKSGGNPKCEIYTVVNPLLEGFGSVTEAFTNWEKMWT